MRYDSRCGKYGYDIEDQNPVVDHSVRLTRLQAETTYHFVIESVDSDGNSVRGRDHSFTTLSSQDNRKPSVFLEIPDALSGEVVIRPDTEDDTGVDRVVFFLDGEPTSTDYSAPFEWECDTRGLDEGSHDFRAQAFDAAGNMEEIAVHGSVRNHFAEELSPVQVEILTPEPGAEVYGEVPIGVRVTHELGSRICYLRFELDGEIVWEKDYGSEFGYCVGTPLFETYFWDSSPLEPGSSHVISVGVRDEHDNWGRASRRQSIVEPEVSVSRNVQRNGNYFYVMVTIENTGEIDVNSIEVSDTNAGFQSLKTAQIRRRLSGGDWRLERTIACQVSTEPSGHSCTISTGDLGTLRPNEAIRVEYYAVPVLLSPWEAHTYALGQVLEVSYEAGGREYLLGPLLGTWWSSSAVIDRAFWEADYLIVTKPSALFDRYSAPDVNELLSTMAELAVEKWGVLGYLPDWALNSTLRGLILRSPEGDWHRRLGSFDYLLIVGEDDIVPAFRLACPGFFEPDTGGYIDISDYLYADIAGDGRPELKVGRIIGETASELAIPIRTSISVHRRVPGYGYNGSDVLIVSGPEDTWEASVMNAEGGGSTLRGMGVNVAIVHTDYYTTKHTVLAEALRIKGADNEGARFEADLSAYSTRQLAAWLLYSEGLLAPGTESTFTDSEGRIRRIPPGFDEDEIQTALRRAESIQANRGNRGGDHGWTYIYLNNRDEVLRRRAREVKEETPNQDIIVFLGHGGPGSWGSVLDDWTTSRCPIEPINFGSCRPVVLGWSCLTGNYNDDPGRNIARAFLRNGAAVYIGATEVSSTGENEDATNEAFWRGWAMDSRIGDALFDLKSRKMERGYLGFVYEYNLYGDPKFGGR